MTVTGAEQCAGAGGLVVDAAAAVLVQNRTRQMDDGAGLHEQAVGAVLSADRPVQRGPDPVRRARDPDTLVDVVADDGVGNDEGGDAARAAPCEEHAVAVVAGG